jgi:quinoprotein glucose dehydrogenase
MLIDAHHHLWRGPLPESGRATPMSYRLEDGTQYVVISVGGGGVFGEGDFVVAFRRQLERQRLAQNT